MASRGAAPKPNWFCPKFNCDEGDCAIALPNRTCGVPGCRNPAAANYDPTANIDGPCVITGCMDPAASNYDAAATTDDGNCVMYGCTAAAASNFDPAATEDDGSCRIAGCMDGEAGNYDPTATEDGSNCIYDAVLDCYGRAYSHSVARAKVENGACDAGGSLGNSAAEDDFLGPNFFCARFHYDGGDCDGIIAVPAADVDKAVRVSVLGWCHLLSLAVPIALSHPRLFGLQAIRSTHKQQLGGGGGGRGQQQAKRLADSRTDALFRFYKEHPVGKDSSLHVVSKAAVEPAAAVAAGVGLGADGARAVNQAVGAAAIFFVGVAVAAAAVRRPRAARPLVVAGFTGGEGGHPNAMTPLLPTTERR